MWDGVKTIMVYMMQSVPPVVRLGARKQLTRNPACSSARNAAPSACAFLQEHTETSNSAPATTTGRPREEDPSALRIIISSPRLPLYLCVCNVSLVPSNEL